MKTLCLAVLLWTATAHGNCRFAIGETASPILDGLFDEWTDEDIVSYDPAGDQSAAFDLTFLSAKTAGSRLYLRFDLGQTLNLQNGPKDQGTLQLLIGLPGGRTLSIDFRERLAHFADTPHERIPWAAIDFACLPTFASDSLELRLDLRHFGVTTGQGVTVDFRGSDRLPTPVTIQLNGGRPIKRQPTQRLNETDLRIASLNTLRGGLGDNRRIESIQRLIAAVRADIYCFQEENDEDSFRRATRRLGKTPNCHWANDCGIATRHPLAPLPMNLSQGAVASVELPGRNFLVVCSVHLKCCGFAGSDEDQLRIEQAEQLAVELNRLRNGDYGDELQNAAIVVIGDYNLVGSRRPLGILESLGLTERILLGQADYSATTWRGRSDEPFWPGRLDIVSFDAKQLRAANGYVLDTSRMAPSTRKQLGLLAEDSQVSDHLLLVADFAVATDQ